MLGENALGNDCRCFAEFGQVRKEAMWTQYLELPVDKENYEVKNFHVAWNQMLMNRAH